MTETHDAWEITVVIESPRIDGMKWYKTVRIGSDQDMDKMKTSLRIMGCDTVAVVAKQAVEGYVLLREQGK